MEIKEEAAERRSVAIAKPVACRPTCNSTFGSFSELLSGPINASSTSNISQTSSSIAAAIIKPKTLRLNPPPPSHSTIIYRPQPKLVSKGTACLLANMGSFNSTLLNQLSPCSNNAAVEELRRSSAVSIQQIEEDNPKTLVASARPSYDGYNWRKYGQKQVKGSEYPRSYYKCTHPSCPVKKKVERSLDGQIAEIVYKAEHNHSKPSLPARRNSLGGEACGVVGGELRTQSGLLLLPNSNAGTGLSGHPAPGTEVHENQDEPISKRRKAENQTNNGQLRNGGEVGGRETGTNGEVLGDGFRWRKYGQKVVRGNPHPRSYYRCTNMKCKVRKYVERSPDDPKALVTTYEGKHNHDIHAT